jgi:hypothetical protein
LQARWTRRGSRHRAARASSSRRAGDSRTSPRGARRARTHLRQPAATLAQVTHWPAPRRIPAPARPRSRSGGGSSRCRTASSTVHPRLQTARNIGGDRVAESHGRPPGVQVSVGEQVTAQDDDAPPGHWLTRFLVLRLLGLVYLMAFLTWVTQGPALFGSRGLLPAVAVSGGSPRYFGWPIATRSCSGPDGWASRCLPWCSRATPTR